MVRDSWTTIESDPGVFTELIERIGVTGVQVEELWALDAESLAQLRPIYGLVFLFKYEKAHARERSQVAQDAPPGVFFAEQVIPNACATQAIISILLNLPPTTPGVSLGAELTAFRDFTAELPTDMKGLAISNSEVIRTVHNSLARPESLLPDEDQKQQEDGEAFHFIAYVPVGGTLYELDGLQRGPIPLATDVPSEDAWLHAVIPHISARMEQYAGGEVRFNLMALVADRRRVLADQIQSAEEVRSELVQAGQDTGGVDHQLNELREALAAEHAKRTAWGDENVRRTTNYVPLMFNLVRAIAEAGAMQPFLHEARKPRKPGARGE